MSKTRSTKLPWEVRTADVLAGRAKLDAAGMIALVNEVNPTGRGRDAKESAARYALKARLLGVLVTRFPDTLDVTCEPAQQGVVSIRLRARPQVACHAVIEALDDDARSWVTRRLDLGPESDDERRPEAPGALAPEEEEPDSSDPDAVLRAAAHAEAEYDFERAERLFTRAFRAQSDARTALALLRLLVDAMAADAQALALDAELPPAARAHPGVRVLLGLAAARSGEEARAIGYLGHVEDPRAAEVLVVLARGALARGDTTAAELRLAEARAADPAGPSLGALASEIAKACEAARAPHEAELARLVSEDRDVEAMAKASAILARWPGSEAARRTARELEARRQSALGRRLLAEADAARARGEAATALELCQRALGARLSDGDRARAQRARAELEAEERARSVEQVAASLGAQDKQERARGLAVYVELDEELRRRVRVRSSAASLDWLEAMTGAGLRAKAAVDAALALEQAAALGDADPAVILGALAPHERALAHVPFAHRLREQLLGRAAAERRRAALEDLRAAEEALDAGDPERSMRLIERRGRDLAQEDRARADGLRARLAQHGKQQQLQKRFERARASHHWADARRSAEALAALTEGGPRARWLEVIRTLPDELRRERRVRRFDVDAGAECSRGAYIFQWPPTAPACVDLHAGVVVLPSDTGSDVFVRAFSLETGRLVRCIYMVAPKRLDEPSAVLSGESVLVMGGSNGVLELSLASGEPLRFSYFRDPSNMERRFTGAVQPQPGGRYMWVQHHNSDELGIHDLEGERPVRELPDADSFDLLPGVLPPRVAVVRNRSAISLHEPSGNQTARYDFAQKVEAFTPHPAGEGLVVALSRHQGNPPRQLLWAEVSPRGDVRHTGVIHPSTPIPWATMACARDHRMAFIRFQAPEDQEELVALEQEPGTSHMRVAYRVPFGRRRMLVQDQEGRRAYIVGEHDGGIEVTALGPERPALVDRPPVGEFKFPLTKLWGCTHPAARSRQAQELFLARFKWSSVSEIRRRAAELREQRDGDMAALLEVFWAQALSCDAEGAGELSLWLAERFSGEMAVVQAGWAGLAVQRKWAALVEVLDSVEPATLPEDLRKHRHHLLAAAFFALGDVARAAQHLEEGKALQGSCDLKPLDELCEAAAAGPPAGDVPKDLPPLRQLLEVSQAADLCLARGDAGGVLELFERDVVWEHREAQSLARLAVAHLARPATTDVERLRKSFALAMFTNALYENRVGFRVEMLIPGATWPEERLQEIAAGAEAWLAAGHD